MHNKVLDIKINQEDEQLVSDFQEGTEPERIRAYTQIVKKYTQRIYIHTRKITNNHEDADDATQQTFIKIWNHLMNFKRDSQLFSWIYRIATNEALLILRKRKPNVDIDEFVTLTENSTSQSKFMSSNSIIQKLENAAQSLPLKQKIVFFLKYHEELTYEQISEITNTSVGALKSSYHLAIKKIEAYFESHH